MTSTVLLEERVLKTDALGRVKTPPERREALLDEFEKSGMSGTKFALFIGVKYQTWASWVQMRRRRQRRSIGSSKAVEGRAPAVRFVEAMAQTEAGEASHGRSRLRLELPGGAHLEITTLEQARWAGELLRVLRNKEPAHGC